VSRPTVHHRVPAGENAPPTHCCAPPPSARAACGCRWHGATVNNRPRGCRGASLRPPQHGTQIMDNRCTPTGLEPALTVLIHRMPRWQIMRHQTPSRPRTDDPAQAIADLPQAMLTLGSGCGHASQVRGYQGPCLVGDITRVRFAFHPASVASTIQ
jgi:hypothetical protein